MNTANDSLSTLLPADRLEAMQDMIRMTKRLLDLAEREAQTLAMSDIIGFAGLQDEKSLLAQRYMRMSEEFRNRLEEFRGIDPLLLDRLESLQKQLGESTRANNLIVANMKNRAQKNTQATLLTAQELAVRHPVEFQDNRKSNPDSASK